MSTLTFLDQTFTQIPHFTPGEYDGCTFRDCALQEADLSNTVFTACTFERCDLSMAILKNTSFKEVRFKDCKMLGLRLDDCKHFLLEFTCEDCLLNLSSFYGLPLKNTVFLRCSLVETEFVEADLSGARFDDCDLAGAAFEHTNLVNADLRTARNYIIDPEMNALKGASFSRAGLEGLLMKYGINIE